MKQIFIILFLVSLGIPQKSLAQKKKDLQTQELYLFGVGTSFNDSTTYMSAIQRFQGDFIEKKTGFLENRAVYATQMKIYLEQNYPGYETCAIFFSTDKKKIEKKYTKLHRMYLKDKTTRLKEIPVTEFTFNPIKK